MIVCVVDIGRIVEHHCLNFLFITFKEKYILIKVNSKWLIENLKSNKGRQ
jgi:hypothetical protein